MELERVNKNGKRYVLVPEERYEDLLDDLDSALRIDELRGTLSQIRRGEMETFPGDFVFSLCDAASTAELVTLWRGYRGLTQLQLAKASGVSRGMIGQIETGAKEGSVQTLKSLSRALRCDLDDLVR